MAKRDDYYEGLQYQANDFPTQDEMKLKQCDICGLAMAINNWPDGKSRTPTFKDFVICVECDPRHVDDRYVKKGYRILHPRRLRAIHFAQISRAMGKRPCMRGEELGCGTCPACAARKLFPTPPYRHPSTEVVYGNV